MRIRKVVILAIGFVVMSGFAEPTQPNIIFLLSDDQSTHSTGCYGNPEAKTPNMDQLGADGIIFDRHYDTTAICMASRATIMTGMYEYKTGCNFTKGKVTSDKWTRSYPILLRENGYFTGFAGKFGFDIDGVEPDTAFDVYGGGPGQTSYETAKSPTIAHYADQYPHATRAYGAFGQDFVKQAVKQELPFCLSISFKAPHRPSKPDPEFDAVYGGVKFTKPGNFGPEHGTHLSEQSRQGRQYERFASFGYKDKYDETMASYFQLVYGVDVAIGMIRDELERQGIADNTVIIFTSDNGYICGSHGYASKVLPMEEASRVPLIIFDPRGGNAGKKLRCGSLTGNIDFAPTLLELAGLPIPENMDGKSLLPLVADPGTDIREHLALINTWGETPTTCLSLVTKNHKYSYWWYSDETMSPTEELFDTTKDPLELKNLATNPEYGPALEEMRKNYDKELSAWKQQAEEKYQPYGTYFDRNVSAASKAELLSRVGNKKDKKSKK